MTKKRQKPDKVVAVPDVAAADEALGEIAALNREIAQVELRMNEAIDDAKAKAKKQSEPLLERRQKLEAGLQAFAETNKADYFSDRRKTLELVHGFLGFRLSTAVSIVKEKTLALLKQFKYVDAIRVKEGVDKEVLAAWPDAKLAQVRAKKVCEDTFWYEVKQEEVEKQGAGRKE